MGTDSDLTRLAMRTLEDALARAHHGPVKRTWGHRLALAWMAQTGIPLDWHCQKFWQAMIEDHDGDDRPAYASMYRVNDLTGILDNWYLKMGWKIPGCIQRGKWADAYGTKAELGPET
jgi:hypothetical protein